MMKGIDKQMNKNKNGKGSPAKLNEKYYTDNDAAENRKLNDKRGSKEIIPKKARDQSTSPENKRRLQDIATSMEQKP